MSNLFFSMFLKKSVSVFAPLVKKQKLSIQFDLSEEYSGYFDVDKLDKVVYNLLSNAAALCVHDQNVHHCPPNRPFFSVYHGNP